MQPEDIAAIAVKAAGLAAQASEAANVARTDAGIVRQNVHLLDERVRRPEARVSIDTLPNAEHLPAIVHTLAVLTTNLESRILDLLDKQRALQRDYAVLRVRVDRLTSELAHISARNADANQDI